MVAHILGWFFELDLTRSAGPHGPEPIGYTEIEAWSRLRDVSLEGWELAALLKMDQRYLQKAQEMMKIGDNYRSEVVTERPLTMELFDALFG